MSRPNSSRRNPSRRLNLEKLENLILPGESVLSVVAAGFVAEQFSSADLPYFAPPRV